nr:PfkB family carbohydrate kinase [Halapricum sp. CBA1109]
MDEPLAADAVQSTRDMQFTPGGDGINVSEFVHALGGETVATGVTGGFTGYFIEQDLSGLDVPTDFCSVDSAPTRINTTILTPPPEGPQTTRVATTRPSNASSSNSSSPDRRSTRSVSTASSRRSGSTTPTSSTSVGASRGGWGRPTSTDWRPPATGTRR